jgi:hypothetical protein
MKISNFSIFAIIESLLLLFSFIGCNSPNLPKKTGHPSYEEKYFSHLNKIIYENEKFLAIGTGLIMYSRDGTTWENVPDHPYHTANGWAFGIFKSAYGNGIWLITGVGYMAYSTDDCVTWSIIPDLPSNYGYEGIAYGAGKFVALDRRQIVYSDTSILWEAVQNNPFNPVEDVSSFDGDISYNDGKFIAVMGSKIAYSEDGISWALAEYDSNSSERFYYITYGGGKWLVVGNAGVYSSDDGCEWTITENKYPPGTAIAYGGGKFVAINSYANSGKYNIIAYSEDGVSWTQVEDLKTQFNITDNPIGITYGNGKFIVYGRQDFIIQSIDGINWHEVQLEFQ